MTKGLSSLADAFALVGGAILGIIVFLTTTNVAAFILDRIARSFGENVSGLPGYEDVVRLAISCAALMFLPYCQLNRGHVAVDIVTANLAYPIRRAIDRAWLVLIAAMAWFLAYWMVLGMFEKRSDNVLAGVIGWSEWPFYIPGILSLILWGCVSLMQMTGEPTDV